MGQHIGGTPERKVATRWCVGCIPGPVGADKEARGWSAMGSIRLYARVVVRPLMPLARNNSAPAPVAAANHMSVAASTPSSQELRTASSKVSKDSRKQFWPHNRENCTQSSNAARATLSEKAATPGRPPSRHPGRSVHWRNRHDHRGANVLAFQTNGGTVRHGDAVLLQKSGEDQAWNPSYTYASTHSRISHSNT